jgi:hypothetical protein
MVIKGQSHLLVAERSYLLQFFTLRLLLLLTAHESSTAFGPAYQCYFCPDGLRSRNGLHASLCPEPNRKHGVKITTKAKYVGYLTPPHYKLVA